MKYIAMTLIAMIALSACTPKKNTPTKMDEKRYNRQINDAQQSVNNIDN